VCACNAFALAASKQQQPEFDPAIVFFEVDRFTVHFFVVPSAERATRRHLIRRSP
jgi:hypothetical protein